MGHLNDHVVHIQPHKQPPNGHRAGESVRSNLKFFSASFSVKPSVCEDDWKGRNGLSLSTAPRLILITRGVKKNNQNIHTTATLSRLQQI